MRQRAHLFDDLVDFRAEAVDHLGGVAGVAVERLAGEPELDPQGDELLLGAVVEVALDLAAGAVGGAGEPFARGRHVVQRGGEGGVEALALEPGDHAGGDRVEEVGVVAEAAVADDRDPQPRLRLRLGQAGAGAGGRSGGGARPEESSQRGRPPSVAAAGA